VCDGVFERASKQQKKNGMEKFVRHVIRTTSESDTRLFEGAGTKIRKLTQTTDAQCQYVLSVVDAGH
jgi:hypothetical protein